MSGIGGLLKIALPLAGIALTGGAGAGLVGAAGAASAGAGAVGAAAATAAGAGVVGSAAAAAGAGSLFGTLGQVFSVVNQVGGVLSGVTSAAGTAYSTYAGAQSNAFAARQASINAIREAETFEYQAGVSTINASIMERNREYEVQSAYAAEQILLRQNRKFADAAKAAFGAAGVSLSGSALDVIADTAAEGQLNVALRRFESAQRQFGFETQRDAAIKESEQYKKAAGQSRENAQAILEESAAAERIGKATAWSQGLDAIPQVVSSVSDILNLFGD